MAAAVFLVSWICHASEETRLQFIAFWPVNAFVLVAVLTSSTRLWPVLLACGLGANLLGDLAAGDSMALAVKLSGCNMFEVTACAAGARVFLGPSPDLLRLENVWKFALLSFGAPLLTMAVAEIVVYRSPLTGWALNAMSTYVLADGLGLLIVTPALLGVNRRSLQLALTRAKPWQAMASLTGLAVLDAIVFMQPDHMMRVLVSAALIAVVVQMETLGAALGLLITTLVSTAVIVDGPTAAAAQADRLAEVLRLQLFLGVSAVINLWVAGVLDQRRRLEQQLRQRQAEAEAAARAKSDFLANMTHELRTPLTAVIGFSDLLKASPALRPEEARQARLIFEASQSLLGVVNDILDFSKMDDGGLELEQIAFDPAELAAAVVSIMQGQAAGKGLELTVTARGLGGRVLGDQARLRQVMLNLLSNAVKFTDRGWIALRVEQRPEGEGRRLRIEVEDTGIGVSPDLADHIFERFTQADASVTRTYGGTGLGLAISRRIVEAHGGDIGVEARSGGGSTFWFELVLPLAPAAPASLDASPVAARQARALRLLLAEDNPVNREVICAILGPFGVDITLATDGMEAVEAALHGDFDAILMDVQMPGMDGLTATRRIRASPKDRAAPVPIIAMTANVLPEQVASCHQAGMSDHVGKPIELEKLLQALDRCALRRREPGSRGIDAA